VESIEGREAGRRNKLSIVLLHWIGIVNFNIIFGRGGCVAFDKTFMLIRVVGMLLGRILIVYGKLHEWNSGPMYRRVQETWTALTDRLRSRGVSSWGLRQCL
jgi:hypothetical protein